MDNTLKTLKKKIDMFTTSMQSLKDINKFSDTISERFTELENNIDTLSSLEIWEQLFDLIYEYCNCFNFFKQDSNIYMGFDLLEVKDFIFQSITASINVYATKKYNDLTPYKATRHNKTLIYNTITDTDSLPEDVDISKGIKETYRKNADGTRKNFKTLIENAKNFNTTTVEEDYCKSLYLNYLSQALSQIENNNQFISHSLELSNFLYSRNNIIKNHNKNIAMRYEISFLEKLSNDILICLSTSLINTPNIIIDNKTRYPLEQLNSYAQTWEFENIFKTSLINQILHIFNNSRITIKSKQAEYDYLRYICILKTLPPLWLYGNEESNILKFLSDYTLSTLDDEHPEAKFVLIEITTTLFKELVYNFLECTYTYFIFKKYKTFDVIRSKILPDKINNKQIKIDLSDLEYIHQQEQTHIAFIITTFLNLEDNCFAPFSSFYTPNLKETCNTCDSSDTLSSLTLYAHYVCATNYNYFSQILTNPNIDAMLNNATKNLDAIFVYVFAISSCIKSRMNGIREYYSRFPFTPLNDAVKESKAQLNPSKSSKKDGA